MASETLNLEPRTGNFGVRDACLILVVIIACVFANGLTTPYMFDDVYWIRDNPAIRTLWPPSSARRPLGYYSLQIDYAVHGNGVFGYHAINIAIHAAAAVVLFSAGPRDTEPQFGAGLRPRRNGGPQVSPREETYGR